ncbi:hypothetical protein [Falsiroseomonas stagni]|uniref:Uncharacterized protein n=1 Tax=Falsiroseomonas stagni DSM 19981 TaxID=1123062 RepID=A0A1I4BCB5_9PROT|nr:hypothetical protein [Falsiroseomonas stagni]SFK65940.1 hypothetical protein SAMN02745775_105143 [Falsiroseomonas stagni DSM 19981]
MTALPTVFGDGVIDVHVASGVARITLGAQTGAAAAGGADAKPVPSALLVVPVLQLPNLARVLVEVTKQIEARAKEAMTAQQKPAETPAGGDQVAGAFRFNG